MLNQGESGGSDEDAEYVRGCAVGSVKHFLQYVDPELPVSIGQQSCQKVADTTGIGYRSNAGKNGAQDC